MSVAIPKALLWFVGGVLWGGALTSLIWLTAAVDSEWGIALAVFGWLHLAVGGMWLMSR